MAAAHFSPKHVTAIEAYRRLADADAVLVDVRTRAEWVYVGVPNLSALNDEPIFLEWQQYPSMAVDPGFPATLAGKLGERNLPIEASVFFICRSGARSLAAAEAMAATGYLSCFNVSDGFEGPRNEDGHRGRLEGWKAAGLPWSQP